MADSGPSPLVTIGVFCFNQASFLDECLSGVLAQEYPNLEVVLVDDGSHDRSPETLREAAENRDTWRVIHDRANRGLAARIQQVVELARGEWLIWVAADDALLPGAVTELVSAADATTAVVFGDLAVMDEASRSSGYVRPADTWQGPTARKYRRPAKPLADLLRVNNFVPGGMTLIRRSAVQSVGGYPVEIRIEDYNMWLLLSGWANFRYVAKTVGRYRVVATSGSRNEPVTVLDHAQMARFQLQRGTISRAGGARLVAMRWWLSVARTRGRPPVGLGRLAEVAGLTREEIVRQLPAAGWDPVVLSVVAYLRLLTARTRRLVASKSIGRGERTAGRQDLQSASK